MSVGDKTLSIKLLLQSLKRLGEKNTCCRARKGLKKEHLISSLKMCEEIILVLWKIRLVVT